MITGLGGVLLLVARYGHHGGGMSDWVAHMAISAVVHAVIYGFVFRLMGHLTLGQDAVVACAVLAVLLAWARARDRRGW